MEIICGIYTITNLVNSKIYVGYSNNIRKRLNIHKNELRKGIHINIYLQNSFNKYGESSFSFEVLEECSFEFLPVFEHYWCYWLNTHNSNNGYNIRKTNPEIVPKFIKKPDFRPSDKSIAHMRSFIPKLSLESKEKIRNSLIGHKHSEETKRKMSLKAKGHERNKGKKASLETRKKMSIKSSQRTHSEETKKKMSIARSKFWQNKKN